MKKMLLLFVVFTIFFFKSPVFAATLTICQSGCQFVGGDGIQQAIDAAKDGDTILVENIPGGEYLRRPVAGDESANKCFIDTKGKSITIKGSGMPILNSQNDEVVLQIPGLARSGICINGGKVTIDSLMIKQTLRPALDVRQAQAIIKNMIFLDIDSGVIDVRQSQVMILNNFFAGSAGPGVMLHDTAYARIENNTFYGNGGAGITFDLCKTNQPSGDVSKNLIINPGDLFSQPLSGSGIGADCRNEEQKIAKIKTADNFVWKGKNGDCLAGPDERSQYEDCVAGEICAGSTITYPYLVGDGEHCVWGEGIIKGNFNTSPASPVTQAGAGFGGGPCAVADSAACLDYIKNNPLPTPVPPPTVPPPPSAPAESGTDYSGQKQGAVVFEKNPTVISPFFFQSTALIDKNKKKDGMDLFLYILLTATYIMVIHFAVVINEEFNIFLMVGIFILTGVVGWYLKSYELAFFAGMVLSLLFW